MARLASSLTQILHFLCLCLSLSLSCSHHLRTLAVALVRLAAINHAAAPSLPAVNVGLAAHPSELDSVCSLIEAGTSRRSLVFLYSIPYARLRTLRPLNLDRPLHRALPPPPSSPPPPPPDVATSLRDRPPRDAPVLTSSPPQTPLHVLRASHPQPSKW